MNNLWNETAAQHCTSALALLAYSSRLIGSDRSLVLYGGGNTSLKQDKVLHVKATGTDLGIVEEQHFTALDLTALRELMADVQLPDAELMRRIDGCKHDPAAPRPSIETLLHAALPAAFVEHAHADAVLAVANVAEWEAACAAAFGDLAPVVPYRHSGAALARACKSVFEREASTRTIGLILAFHGVVAFGNTARESYDNLLRLVTLAEDFLQQHGALPATAPTEALSAKHTVAMALCDAVSAVAGFPLATHIITTPQTLAFAQHPDVAEISQQGPPTPQHAVYTKRVPLLDGNVAAYATAYRDYLSRTLGTAADGRIDAAPRIALNPEVGLCAFGVDEQHAAIAAEIYLHDIDIISRASSHGRYCSASEQDIARAELEYGGFEQRVRARITSLKG